MPDLAVIGCVLFFLLLLVVWDAWRKATGWDHVRNGIWISLVLAFALWLCSTRRSEPPPSQAAQDVESLIKRSQDDSRRKAQGHPSSRSGDTPLTLAAFHRLRDGMSYSEVRDIFGSSGTLVASSSPDGSPVVEGYEWSASGTAVACTFEDGKLVAKVQAGLR